MLEKLATKFKIDSDGLAFILTFVKYSIALVLGLTAAFHMKSWQHLLASMLELWAIIFLTEILIAWKRIPALVINDILMFLYNVQMALLFFANSYLSLIMLDNLDSVEDLSGKAIVYILAIIAVIVISVLPVAKLHLDTRISLVVFSACYITALGVGLFLSDSYSPLYAYVRIGMRHYSNVQRAQAVLEAGDVRSDFYKEEIRGEVSRPQTLSSTPNVIVIFAEGLSQHIIDDGRNITPNLAEFQEKSLRFTNYYNHTFATYRGLQGQLFSGYQQDNYDANGLISIQSIFSDLGYQTAFINTEPNNPEFSNYLEELGFDSVVGEPGPNYEGETQSMSDREGYELLFDTVKELASAHRPYFASIYTFGTHASLGSPNKQFKTGRSDELNKFFDTDWWFAEFFDKLEQNKLLDDTLVVFTTDHASYSDYYYQEAFPDYKRIHGAIDEIPLMLWHKGIEPQAIDVEGRNSLCFAPTLLDYLDISVPNYFLGGSLFLDKDDEAPLLTTFHDVDETMSTDNDEIVRYRRSQELLVEREIDKYFAAKMQ
ncbi:MAG: LTA synthase family protein [Atopobiaceae bacterium]|nr:LTA synthase family protein [Atopobiaceae bacterium]